MPLTGEACPSLPAPEATVSDWVCIALPPGDRRRQQSVGQMVDSRIHLRCSVSRQGMLAALRRQILLAASRDTQLLEEGKPAGGTSSQQATHVGGPMHRPGTPAEMHNGLRKEQLVQSAQLQSRCAWVSVRLCIPEAYRACSLLALTSPRGVGCSSHLFLQVCEAAIPVALHPCRAALAEAPAGMRAKVRHIQTCLDPCNVPVKRAS